MEKKVWVQHKSGHGEKFEAWELGSPTHNYWKDVYTIHRHGQPSYFLPKSEYIECEPPETWVDVTEECHAGTKAEGEFICVIHKGTDIISTPNWYRLRKIDVLDCAQVKCAFIVERKQSQVDNAGMLC